MNLAKPNTKLFFGSAARLQIVYVQEAETGTEIVLANSSGQFVASVPREQALSLINALAHSLGRS